MGHDIVPIGNHQLDVTNIEKLARDIFKRLHINIEYGYFGRKEHFELLGEARENDWVVLGKLTTNKSDKYYKLIDEKYQEKQLISKFGTDIVYDFRFWSSILQKGDDTKSLGDSVLDEVVYATYALEYEWLDEFHYLNIYDEHFENLFTYYGRWWYFCRFFLEKRYNDDYDLESFNKYRKDLLDISYKLGGDKLLFLDDQSEVLTGVGGGEEYRYTWQALQDFVFEKTEPLCINIPNFLENKAYRSTFYQKKAYPLAFVDDFSDLKSKKL